MDVENLVGRVVSACDGGNQSTSRFKVLSRLLYTRFICLCEFRRSAIYNYARNFIRETSRSSQYSAKLSHYTVFWTGGGKTRRSPRFSMVKIS